MLKNPYVSRASQHLFDLVISVKPFAAPLTDLMPKTSMLVTRVLIMVVLGRNSNVSSSLFSGEGNTFCVAKHHFNDFIQIIL